MSVAGRTEILRSYLVGRRLAAGAVDSGSNPTSMDASVMVPYAAEAVEKGLGRWVDDVDMDLVLVNGKRSCEQRQRR
eukprot:jgi/Tetstr1/430534/TSEL_020332.t1